MSDFCLKILFKNFVKIIIKMKYSLEPNYRKYVQGYGFF